MNISAIKQKALAATIFLFVCFVGFGFARLYFRELKDRKRITESFKASTDSLTYYRTRSGKLAAKNQALQLKYNEVKEIYPQVMEEIRNLNIRPKLVNQYSETVIKQEKEFVTHLKDSIIHDTLVVKVFKYQDDFYSVNGIATGDSQKISISSTDSLVQVVYKGERVHPWLWVFSRRKIEQAITSKNPNNIILYNKTIQIVKK